MKIKFPDSRAADKLELRFGKEPVNKFSFFRYLGLNRYADFAEVDAIKAMDKENSFEKKDILLKELRFTNTLRLLKRYVLSGLRCSIKTWSTILAIRYKEIAFEI